MAGPGQAVTLYDASGNVISTSNPLQASEYATYGGDVLRPRFVGNFKLSGSITLTTTFQTIGTGAPFYYLTNFVLNVDPLSSVSGGGTVVIILRDSVAGTIWEWYLFLPASPTLPTVATNIELKTPPDFFFKSSSNGSTLQIAVNVALSVSSFAYNFSYGITSIA